MRSLFGFLIENRIPILGGLAWRLRRFILPAKDTAVKIKGTPVQITVNPNSYMGTHIYLFGKWEKDVTDFVLSLSKKKVIVDVGAHIGYYSLLFTNILPKDGKILAFEPGDEARERLLTNIHPYKDQIKVESFAISDQYGKVFLKGDKVVAPTEGYDSEIECITLDEYFKKNQLTEVDLIKIDIEGHEYAALKGMDQLLTKYKPELLLEVHPLHLKNIGHSENDVLDLLKQHGYSTKLLSKESDDNFMLYCFKN